MMCQGVVQHSFAMLCSAALTGTALFGMELSFEQNKTVEVDVQVGIPNLGQHGQKKQINLPKPHPKYRNIIFDLGGVLFNFNPKETLPRVFSEKAAVPWDIIDSIKTFEWAEWDRGTMSVDQVCDALAHKYNPDDMKRFVSAVVEYLTPLPAGVEILQAVQARGYNTYVLSNLSEQSYRRIYFKNAFFSTFKGAIFSYQVKTVKPEPDIYKTLLKTYDLLPDECLFIDDLEININAGRSLGIDGIVCKNHEYVREELKRLGVLE
jgi:HAD superfamily hydrolase (TIGR01509 family)